MIRDARGALNLCVVVNGKREGQAEGGARVGFRGKKELNKPATSAVGTTVLLGRKGKGMSPTGVTGTPTQWLIWQIGQVASAAADLWTWKMLPMTAVPSSAQTTITATAAITEPLRAGFHSSIIGHIYTFDPNLASRDGRTLHFLTPAPLREKAALCYPGETGTVHNRLPWPRLIALA